MCVPEAVRKHTLFTTKQGHLLEVEGGKVQRSVPAPKDVTKVRTERRAWDSVLSAEFLENSYWCVSYNS